MKYGLTSMFLFVMKLNEIARDISQSGLAYNLPYGFKFKRIYETRMKKIKSLKVKELVITTIETNYYFFFNFGHRNVQFYSFN